MFDRPAAGRPVADVGSPLTRGGRDNNIPEAKGIIPGLKRRFQMPAGTAARTWVAAGGTRKAMRLPRPGALSMRMA